MQDATARAEPPRDDSTPPPPPKSIFRNRNFLLLWCAYTTSALGDHLSEMALLDMQEATTRDDSTRIAAIILFVFMLPFFLFGPVMGWLADRLPRKWIMISADVVRALLMLALATTLGFLFDRFAGTGWELGRTSDGTMPIFSPWLYAMPLLITGVFAAMFSPARAAMLPTLIRTDQIVRGNGLMNAMGPIASIASFMLGGYLVARYGASVNFQVDGLTFLVSAMLLLLIVAPRRTPVAVAVSGRNNSLIAGVRYCRTHRRVVELILFTVLFWSAAGVVRSVIPALVGHVFGGGTEHIGYYTAALGLGMLFGAMVLALFGDALRSDIAISWSLVGAGLAIAWLAVVYVFETGKLSGYAGLFVTGMFGSGVLVSANAMLQKIVPDFFRGRVFGVKDLVSMAGLLAATGVLAIPRWGGIDRSVPWLLLAVGLMLLVGGGVSIHARLRRGCFRAAIAFWRNLVEFHVRFVARARREGVCTVPAAGPVIVAANHHSVLDPFLLITTSPNRYPSFMIAREYAELPLLGRLVRMIDCIPVNRTGIDTASVKAALRHLAEGRVLGIFPQGGIRDPAAQVEVQEGVGLLALRSGATVIPAYVATSRSSAKMVTPFLRPQQASVRYGPPVDLTPWEERTKDRAAYHEVAEHIMACVNALGPAQGPASRPD